ncbi:AsnC family transcriptional regulator [Streptomyces sp. NPDC015661]|uniref:AsnC family transcriptional regulator n=1 Tax=Streptomyces sp. NPDC015661 TaxID=3364961 RepID=UPI0036FEF715
MRETDALDELDLELITALQLSPRAPWAQLAGPLGVDAATLSRRWARLRDGGHAWISCYLGPSQIDFVSVALIELDCVPALREELAARIARHPFAFSVEIIAGGCDLLLTVCVHSPVALAEYVLLLDRLPGIVASRVHPVQRMYREGSQWQFDALSREQRRGLSGPSGTGDGTELDPGERRLMLALGEDGRASYRDLAAMTGQGERTVRRMLSAMLAGGRAVLRCDVALPAAGWQDGASVLMSVPPAQLAAAAEVVAAHRMTRLSATVASEANLAAAVWFHRLSDLTGYEADLAARIPGLRVLRRAVTLRTVKRTGRLISARGSARGHVAMDVWAVVEPEEADGSATA